MEKLIDEKKCRKCRFHGTLGNNSVFGRVHCDYIGKTNRKRPCPASDCTVFEPMSGEKKKKRKQVIIHGKA